MNTYLLKDLKKKRFQVFLKRMCGKRKSEFFLRGYSTGYDQLHKNFAPCSFELSLT